MNEQDQKTHERFLESINMSALELEVWLKTPESNSVGWNSSGRKTNPKGEESIGHESGRMIVTILTKDPYQLDSGDFTQMRRVNSYIKRHLGQGPTKQAIETSRWRYSLMNWGHDPLKDI